MNVLLEHTSIIKNICNNIIDTLDIIVKNSYGCVQVIASENVSESLRASRP